MLVSRREYLEGLEEVVLGEGGEAMTAEGGDEGEELRTDGEVAVAVE